MLHKKFLKIIFISIFFFLNIYAVNAVDFTLKIGESSEPAYLQQNEVHIPVTAEKISSYNFLKPFKLDLEYNHDIFEFKEFACNSPFSTDYISVDENDSSVTISSNFEEVNVPFRNRRFLLGDIVLYVKDKTASGEQTFDCFFTQNEFNHKTIKTSTNINLIPTLPNQNSYSNQNSFSNQPYLTPEIIKNQKNKPNGKLKSITPNVGTLSPAFDPNTFEYSVDVDESVQYLEIDAVPQESDSVVKISRRKLLAAGRTTIIKITVSNKGEKTIYIVKVNRGAKSNSKNGGKDKQSEKTKSSSKNHKHKSKSKKDKFGNDIYEDEDDDNYDDEENDDEESINENQITEDENNSKIYLIIVLSSLALTFIGYYAYKFIKYKRKNSKNTKNPLNKPSK